MSRYEISDFYGEPYDCGFQYGETFEKQIKRLLDASYRFLSDKSGMSKDETRKQAQKYKEFVESYSNDLFQEIRGQSEGAGIPPDDLFVLVATNELYANCAYRLCTAFAVSKGATQDGLTYVGQTNDDIPDVWMAGDYVALSRFHQKNQPTLLNYTYPGVPSQDVCN